MGRKRELLSIRLQGSMEQFSDEVFETEGQVLLSKVYVTTVS